jgi:hypothetical protein
MLVRLMQRGTRFHHGNHHSDRRGCGAAVRDARSELNACHQHRKSLSGKCESGFTRFIVYCADY